MEIEIVIAKKKLTKSMINQMEEASMATIKSGKSLGYLCGVRKNIPKVILIQQDKTFTVLPCNYSKSETSVYRRIGKWTISKKFKTSEECQVWWDLYILRLEQPLEQIYV